MSLKIRERLSAALVSAVYSLVQTVGAANQTISGLSMSTPTGESWTAKLDGKDCPVKGAYFFNSVSLKRVDDRTIEETDKRDGKVVVTCPRFLYQS